MLPRWRDLFVSIFILVLPLLLGACGTDKNTSADFANDIAPAPAGWAGDRVGDWTEATDGDMLWRPPATDDTSTAFNPPGDLLVEPPLGDNPAFGYGPFNVRVRRVHVDDDDWLQTAYFFIPERDDDTEPMPTIVWGHGINSSESPSNQMEIYLRHASRGVLIVYPNMKKPFVRPDEKMMRRAVNTYLRAARRAVQLGLADPENMIFAGYSFGARIAALATVRTTAIDPIDFWPNPIACFYEALPDMGYNPGTYPPGLPGTRPSEVAHLIDPSIPQTIVVAEQDMIVPNTDHNSGEPINGPFFFESLQTNFAQLIVLKSGSTGRDRAGHHSFLAVNRRSLDTHDLWGHMKLLFGVANFHFNSRSRHWGYGIMRSVGGLDSAGQPIVHKVYERRHGGPAEPATGAGDARR